VTFQSSPSTFAGPRLTGRLTGTPRLTGTRRPTSLQARTGCAASHSDAGVDNTVGSSATKPGTAAATRSRHSAAANFDKPRTP
jgi:hypothetical protein